MMVSMRNFGRVRDIHPPPHPRWRVLFRHADGHTQSRPVLTGEDGDQEDRHAGCERAGIPRDS